MAHHAVKKLKKTQTDTHSEEVRWMVKLNGGEGTGSQCNREGKEELCRGGARKQRRTYVAWMVCGKVECIWFLTKRCFWNFTYYARCRRTLNSVGRISCKKVMAIGIRLLLHPPPFASSSSKRLQQAKIPLIQAPLLPMIILEFWTSYSKSVQGSEKSYSKIAIPNRMKFFWHPFGYSLRYVFGLGRTSGQETSLFI